MFGRSFVRLLFVGLCFVGLAFSRGEAAAFPVDTAPLACSLWRGTVGESDVSVTLHPGTHSTVLTGRYAYLRIGKPIPLAGTGEGTLVLEERGGPGGKPSGIWALSSANAKAADGLTGTWTAPDRKRTVPIELTCLADRGGKLRDPWYGANLGGHTPDEQFDAFVHNPEQPDKSKAGAEGTTIRHVTLLAAKDDDYDLVDQHPFREAAGAVNAAIRARVAEARKEERRCRADGSRCEINVQIGIDFLSPRFATVSVAGYYDGGGAHPDSDMDLWVFALSEAGATRVKMERVYDLKTAGGAWKRAFRKLIRTARKKGDQDPDCPDDLEDTEVRLGVAPGGINVDVNYSAHAIAACGYAVFLKSEQLAGFLRADAPESYRTGKF